MSEIIHFALLFVLAVIVVGVFAFAFAAVRDGWRFFLVGGAWFLVGMVAMATAPITAPICWLCRRRPLYLVKIASAKIEKAESLIAHRRG